MNNPDNHSPEVLHKISLLEKALKKHTCPKGVEVKVYVYDDLGPRIAEISWTRTKGKTLAGSSFMRCDLSAAPAILAAERYLLLSLENPFTPIGWDSEIDDRQDALDALIKACKG